MIPNKPTPPAQRTSADLFGHSDAMREALVSLAREIAPDVETVETIINRRGITAEQYEKILKNPFYARHLEGFKAEWEGVLNTDKRIKIHSAIILERSLMDLYVRVGDRTEPLSAVVEGVKTFAKLAGIGERDTNRKGDGEKFVISINLGDDKQITEVVTTPVIDVTPTGENHDRAPTITRDGSNR